MAPAPSWAFRFGGSAEIPGEEIDGVVVATFEPPEGHVAELVAIGVPPEKLLTLRRPSVLAPPDGTQP